MSIRLRPDVSLAETPDGTVLLDQAKGRYWQLNATGARILRRLLDGHSPEEIARAIAAGCGIGLDRALRDVDLVTEQLDRAGLAVSR
uniref:Coenzyme PQQ synthesis protein D n=1 Tax=Streptomyces huasconensis TaxID=1854574 RepID=A0A4Y5QXE1_9ACTN|nr:coenzyme PQQ synthesis protein D [Streptomyces huasconensis]